MKRSIHWTDAVGVAADSGGSSGPKRDDRFGFVAAHSTCAGRTSVRGNIYRLARTAPTA